MIKKLFSSTAILAIIAASFLFASTAQQPAFINPVQAASTTLSGYAGIAAYTHTTPIDLEMVKSIFQVIEYMDNSTIIGTLDLPIYESEYDPLVLVSSDGWIFAFYSNSDPAGKLLDVISKNLDETLLEKAVKIVAGAAEIVNPMIDYYDFGNPAAAKMLLVAEYEPDGNAFTLFLDGNNDYYEKSYGFYRTYYPSFTLDNEGIDQVNFVLENQDYIGEGYYGTIYGHFETIDFGTEIEQTFAVQAGDHLGFGALAILYSGDAPVMVADKDFIKEISLIDPVFDSTFDLIPSAFNKTGPFDGAADIGLSPTLSWSASSAPNYEYCIDESPPDVDPATDDCETGWISVGSNTAVDLSNLMYETTYYWQVRSLNSYDLIEADSGNWYSFTTADGVVPFTFSKLSETLKEPTDSLSKVTMTWEPSYGAYYYEVCVDTTEECIAPELWHNVGLNTTATIGELLLDTTYFWQVRAVNYYPSTENILNYTYADAGEWQSFDTRSFRKLRPLQDEVYNLTLPFKWESTPIATDGYEYCIDQSDDDECDTPWKKVSDTSVVVKRLDAGTYYWQVRAGNKEADEGIWFAFDVLAKKDASKINLFKVSPIDGAVDQVLNELQLSWKTTKSAIDYQYCFFPVDDTDTTPISEEDTCTYYEENWVSVGNNTSTTINSLDTTTTYYWQVRANIGNNEDPDWVYADKGDFWAFTTVPE
ncbi:MAG: hypothetical protein CL609_21385 [Anaerolineaceae bacterium]|nr:hypothetical protein [Anaerolineaceae bacterium]